jgi:hypothetical protein
VSEETTNLNSDGLSVDNGVDIMISGTQQLTLDDDDGDESTGMLKDGGSNDAVPVEEPQEEPQAEPTAEPQGEPQVALNDKIEKHTKTLDALGKDLKAKGVDFNQAIKEYNEYGALSSKTMADLAQAGYPAEVIEGFIESRQNLESEFTNAVYNSAGGEQAYNKVIEWAQGNLSNKVLSSFNRAIDNNNLEAVTLMFEGMKAKMIAKQGTRNPTIMGGGVTTGGYKGFSSKQEVVEAMSDPRYGADPSYTRAIEMKMYYTQV